MLLALLAVALLEASNAATGVKNLLLAGVCLLYTSDAADDQAPV